MSTKKEYKVKQHQIVKLEKFYDSVIKKSNSNDNFLKNKNNETSNK